MQEEQLFHQALEQPEDRRASFLDAACGGDAGLRERVEALLRAHADPGSFLGSPAHGVGMSPTLDQPITEKPGAVIGRYKLLEQIGEGGFGVVFMAEQEEPVRRKVALKIIKPGMDTKEVIARFEAERQALAMMDHPNIARVFDAGTTGERNPKSEARNPKQIRKPKSEVQKPGEPAVSDTGASDSDIVSDFGFRASDFSPGRPYFVMELVRGIPITAFCDQNGLTTRERLELFAAVCQAVQHAHQKGIIHRDIKPSNVLVTMHDDRPVPKVIDFGVAKATNQRLTERTLFTRFAQMIGTPLYMSPEQAQMSGLDVDTRSDIYSLGVLLYELLTGTTPFDQQRMREAAYDELLRIIREEEPPRPSLRISTLGDTLPSVAAQRKVEPKKLSALVRGELDWIVMKALEKDRSRRYETASGFERDVQRYLHDEPVQACPPSAAYRLKKFSRRNKAVLSTAAVVALALVFGFVGTTWQAVRATRAAVAERLAHEEAERERDRANNEAAIARAVNEFLNEDLLSQADPENEPDRDIRLRTVLDRGAESIQGRFTDQPLVEAAIRNTLGSTYSQLGEYEKAERHFRRSRDLHQTELGAEHRATLASMHNLAAAIQKQGRYAEAEKLHREVLEVNRRVAGENNPATLVSKMGLANAIHFQLRYAEAEKLHREVLEVRRRVLDENDPATLSSEMNLANAMSAQARHAEAEACYREVLQILQRVLGPQHPFTLRTMHNLADSLIRQGRYAEAEKMHREVLEIGSRVLGAGHPFTLKSTTGLASALIRRDKYAEAAERLNKALASGAKGSGPWSQLAQCHLALGNKQEYEKACRSMVEQFPKPDQRSVADWGHLGQALYRAGRYEEARQSLEKVIELRSDKGPTMDFGPRWWYYTMTLWQLGDKKRARQHFKRLVDIVNEKRSPDVWYDRIHRETAKLLGVANTPGKSESAAK